MSRLRLVLYKTDASPPACAVRTLGDMLGLQFELKDLDFVKLDHKSPEFMKINPIGTVPTLVDGDFALSDSNAIMKYLLTKYGGEKAERLYPSDVRTRAIIDQCMFFNTGVFFIRLKVVALPTFFGGLEGPTAKQLEDIEAAFTVVETYLTRRYVAADWLTLADLALGFTANGLKAMYTLDAKKFPRTTAWLELLEQEPAFKKYSVPAQAQFSAALKMFWELNKQRQ